MLRNPESQRGLFMGLGEIIQNEHFRNTQIWQSTKQGQKWRPFCEGIGEQKSHKNCSKNELCSAAAGLSARHRYPTWWFFSNISTGFLCFHFIPFGMYTTTLAAVREKARARIRPAKLSLPNLRFPAPPFLEESTGGRGWRSSSSWGPSF